MSELEFLKDEYIKVAMQADDTLAYYRACVRFMAHTPCPELRDSVSALALRISEYHDNLSGYLLALQDDIQAAS